jgi:hypothetical protein
MQTNRQAESRRSERLGHESIIKFGADLTLSPYYAVSQNLSDTGMYFKSLFELHPGSLIRIAIKDYLSRQDQVQAKVVWCRKLDNSTTFSYGIGVEFLQ